MAIQPSQGNALERKQETSSLADVVSTILDKGIVIDVFVRVALVGIELLTIDARIVIASVDTYLRFAEAVNRLDLNQVGNQQTLPEMVGNLQEGGASNKTKGMLEGAKDALFGSDDDDEDKEDSGSSSRGRSGSSSSSRSSGSRSSGSRSSGSRSRARSASRGR